VGSVLPDDQDNNKRAGNAVPHVESPWEKTPVTLPLDGEKRPARTGTAVWNEKFRRELSQ
jgi:hypothetical protein